MTKALITFALVALPFLVSPRSEIAGDTLVLRGERISVEYTASTRQAALLVEAESETGLERIEVRDPAGASILALRGRSGRNGLGMYGFRVEAGEVDPASLFEIYPEGLYEIRARTADGRLALGSARLSHRLLPAPDVLFPREGDREVPTSDLLVSWVPDPEAVEYHVNLEQGETDRMSVRVPGGSGSFRVPDGVLAPGRRSLLEIGAVGRDGNCTIVGIAFMTR
jgi:hypothetical protein